MTNRKFESLMKSEIKRIEKFASERDNRKCIVTAYWTEGKDEFTGFQDVGCEICSVENGEILDREKDVIICVCLWDRRRSFIHPNSK